MTDRTIMDEWEEFLRAITPTDNELPISETLIKMQFFGGVASVGIMLTQAIEQGADLAQIKAVLERVRQDCEKVMFDELNRN